MTVTRGSMGPRIFPRRCNGLVAGRYLRISVFTLGTEPRSRSIFNRKLLANLASPHTLQAWWAPNKHYGCSHSPSSSPQQFASLREHVSFLKIPLLNDSSHIWVICESKIWASQHKWELRPGSSTYPLLGPPWFACHWGLQCFP